MRSPLGDLLAAIDEALIGLGAPWYLFGAQAALLYGASRLTADADVTVDIGDRAVEELIAALDRSGFEVRVPDVTSFVERTRVLPVVHTSSGMPVDVVSRAQGSRSCSASGHGATRSTECRSWSQARKT